MCGMKTMQGKSASAGVEAEFFEQKNLVFKGIWERILNTSSVSCYRCHGQLQFI